MNNPVRFAACLLLAAGMSADAQTKVDLRTQGKEVDFSAAAYTKPAKSGTALPAACSVGEMFFKTNAPAGQNWFGCTSANVWTLQGGAGSGLPGMTGNTGKVLSTDGSSAQWRSLGGDASGAPEAVTVTGLQGRRIGTGAPSSGQVLKWNAIASQWEPGTDTAASGAPNYSMSFTAKTVVSIAGAAHGFGTANLLVDCYDQATPAARLQPASVTVHPASYDITVTFASAQTGRCVVNGSGGGGGSVSSVFGRTGAVAAQAGDYSFAQISGTAATSQLPSGISAAKIGAGSVDDTKFGFLANVTGDVQGQLNSKASASHSHTTGGDLSGDLSSATVGRIQNRQVSAAAPADGQALVWSALSNSWAPGTISGGGTGGASMASQLGDLNVVRSGGTVLTIGSNCSPATPCNVRFGNTVYSITTSCTATISAGTGTAYIFVASGGTVTVGHNMTVAVSAGCVAQGSTTSFPADSLPLFTWIGANGTWDPAGTDLRGWLATKTIGAGTGVATVESAGRTIVAVDAATVPTYLTSSAVLDFPVIAAGACSADLTFTVSGADVQNAVAAGWPSGLAAGLVGMMRVSAANTVAVRLCNLSGSSLDPPNGTFRATIVRSF